MTEATTGLPIEGAAAASLLERVDQTIHPRCEMHAYALTRLDEEPAREYYLEAAHYLVTRLQAFLEEEGTVLETASMLDFAAGYGRFTRFFVHWQCFVQSFLSLPQQGRKAVMVMGFESQNTSTG